MRFVIGYVLYEFKVAVSNDFSTPAIADYVAVAGGEFQVDLKFRKFQTRSRSPAIELRRSLRLSRTETSMAAALMSDALQEFDIPENVLENMATHFKFHVERLSRLNSRRSGNIPVTASVDVREIPPEKAAEVQMRRNEAARRENQEDRRAAAEVMPPSTAPAKRSAVEAMERERVRSGEGEEERECGICLERLAEGEEVIKMPCFHVYHKDCIIRWLDRNHFCPFCHFKLPS